MPADFVGASQWPTLDKIRALFAGYGGIPMEERIGFEVALQAPRFARVAVKKKVGGVKVATGTYAEKIDMGPYIPYEKPIVIKRKGKDVPLTKTTLLTWTSKMSAPSFSIPAGPTKYHGTCPASVEKNVIKEGSYEEFHEPLEGRRQVATKKDPTGIYICDICYCGKNNYLIHKSGFVSQMVRTLKYLQEPKIEAVLLRNLVSSRYFRIHDAGDFFSPWYYVAWTEICRRLPEVKFWCPSRVWTLTAFREFFRRSPPPANLALRPSALFVGAVPPRGVHGLADGSTSTAEGYKLPRGVRACPVYDSDDPVHSCARAHCRWCWDKTGEISYRAH